MRNNACTWMPVFFCFVLHADPEMTIDLQWPSGSYSYSLPQAKDRCPAGGWSSGWIYQDNEDNNNANSCDPPNVNDYLRIGIGNNFKTYYCTKKATFYNNGFTWPKGSYCIARCGGSCPSGFSSGSIYWDDEDNNNDNDVSNPPDGKYNQNTKVYYCCRADGSANSEIMLPPTKDFILYRYNGVCQKVKCMDTTELKIHFDDEDRRNDNSCSGAHPDCSCSRDQDIYMCHYNTKSNC